jgi:homogentisate 1,2-dioxygenase
MLDIPTPAPSLMDVPNRRPENGEWELRIKRDDVQTSIFYPYCPLDVEGWKGDLTAYRLHIGDFLPVMSHRAHLAPSVHTTWTAGGFVVCSFVPRPLEEAPEAVRVPFYHRNIDYDEVIFYHDGDFFSRHGITPGMLTWHPAGIHHGPHPQAVAASRSKTRTNEVAVMVDTQRPLYPVSEALPGLEWQAYVDSWK